MTIFVNQSLDRHRVDWTEKLELLTPVELHGGVHVKREDLFAPLGDGGINGSKLRGCIYMLERRSRDAEVIVTGASVKSPQHSMTAAVCRHLGMRSIHVIGATKPKSAMERPQVRMAARFGAQFDIINVAYNPNLQRRVADLQYNLEFEGTPVANMPYGISPEPGQETYEFHRLGGLQTANLPDVSTLIVPAGSCNTLASILMGLQDKRPAKLKRIVTVGIGPDRTRWLWDRLETLGVRDGYRYHGPASSVLKRDPVQRNYLELVHLDPHGEGFSDYQGEMKENLGDLVLHPTYEGKVARYIKKFYPHLLCEDSCFWVVGGPASEAAMERHFPFNPKELPLWA